MNDDISSHAVLVVDDHELVLHNISSMLEDFGYCVLPARNSADAIALLLTHGARISGLITDIRLNDGLDGWELSRMVRDKYPAIPVAYMTGDCAQDMVGGVPGSVILEKPFMMADLLAVVADMTGEQEPVAPTPIAPSTPPNPQPMVKE